MELFENRAEVCRARKLNHLERLFVRHDDVLDTLDRRVLLEIDWEAVARSHFLGPGTKAEHREPLIVIVGFDRTSDAPECLLVHVWVLAAVMKRVRLMHFTVAASVVNGTNEADLPASGQVVQEARWCDDLELLKNDLTVATVTIEVSLSVQNLFYGEDKAVKAVASAI